MVKYDVYRHLLNAIKPLIGHQTTFPTFTFDLAKDYSSAVSL